MKLMTRSGSTRFALAAAMLLALTALWPAVAQPLPAVIVVKQGDPAAGSTVSSVNAPFTNGNGLVGFTGSLAVGGNFVWYDNGVRWLNTDALPADTLTGAEGTMGVGNSAEFIYSPSVGGDDAVWTHNGLLLKEGMQSPGFAPGVTNTFNSRPTMTPDGTAFWIAGYNSSGGTTTEGRVFYRAPGADSTQTAVVIKSGDLVGGFPIASPSGIGFGYWVSDNNLHHIHILDLNTGSTANNGVVYLDGGIAARESFPTGDGDNWSGFSSVAVNDQGDYVIAGDTDGPTATDAFVAVNGQIAVREGDTIDGFVLSSSASLRAISINNAGYVAHLWGVGSGAEALFVGRASDLAASSRLVAATGTTVDTDGDGAADYAITDFAASSSVSPGVDLATGMLVFVEVDLAPVGGGAAVEAIVGFGACAGPLVLTGTLASPTQLQLQWSACPTVGEFWLYGAGNAAYFSPGFAPGYAYRIGIFPPGTLSTLVAGPGDPSVNVTFLVVAVTPGGVEMARSNRFGEFDFPTGGP